RRQRGGAGRPLRGDRPLSAAGAGAWPRVRMRLPATGAPAMPRLLLRCLLLCCLALLAGCPKASSKGSALEQAQYAWSAAIRWGDFEGAWNLVDPQVREAHPLTDLDFSRYKQVQISSYREKGVTGLGNGEVLREIEIGVVN